MPVFFIQRKVLHARTGHAGGVYRADRDEVATVNMMMCAVAALEYGRSKCERRPTHLCRNATLANDDLDHLIYNAGNASC